MGVGHLGLIISSQFLQILPMVVGNLGQIKFLISAPDVTHGCVPCESNHLLTVPQIITTVLNHLGIIILPKMSGSIHICTVLKMLPTDVDHLGQTISSQCPWCYPWSWAISVQLYSHNAPDIIHGCGQSGSRQVSHKFPRCYPRSLDQLGQIIFVQW